MLSLLAVVDEHQMPPTVMVVLMVVLVGIVARGLLVEFSLHSKKKAEDGSEDPADGVVSLE